LIAISIFSGIQSDEYQVLWNNSLHLI